MDAGVPMKAHVAGIAMGLIRKESASQFHRYSPGRRGHTSATMALQGGGTERGVTCACADDIDIKIEGTYQTEIMQVALARRAKGRMQTSAS